MLEQMLKKLFESDSKAASGRSDHIKAGVLSRIETERSMNHLRIKPLIIGAAAAVVGLTSVMLTVNASMDKKVLSNDPPVKPAKVDFYSHCDPETREAFKTLDERVQRENAIMKEYTDGKIIETMKNGGISIEKELDETDVVGYVPPRCAKFSSLPPTEEELEYVKRIEEDPESLGLTPIGKSETFAGGLRIVNRHYENKNEFINNEKIYYSFRRIYTDDEENRLIASTYEAFMAKFPPYDPDQKIFHSTDYDELILSVFLDHTEDGCLVEPGELMPNSGGLWGTEHLSTDGTQIRLDVSFWRFKSYDKANKSDIVPVGSIIAVTEDGTQWID